MEVTIAERKREQRILMRREYARHSLGAYVKDALRQIQSVGAFCSASAVIAYDPLRSLEIPYVEILKNNHPDKAWIIVPKRISDDQKFFYHLRSFTASHKHGETVLLVPSLALDESGNRLGKGGGFYDKLIREFPNFPTISVVPDFARVSVLHESHDMRIEHPLFAVVS